MAGEHQFEGTLAERLQHFSLGVDDHSRGGGGSARRRETGHAFNINNAQPACSIRRKVFVRANRGYLYPGLPGHIENHRSLVGFDFDPVNSKAYLWHGIPFQCCVYSVHQHRVEMTDITA
jgi:hypothetical protein